MAKKRCITLRLQLRNSTAGIFYGYVAQWQSARPIILMLQVQVLSYPISILVQLITNSQQKRTKQKQLVYTVVKMTRYLGVLQYIAIATGLGMVILFASYKVRPRRLDLEKATAYECGFEPFGERRSPFDVGFYLVAIQFLVFDIEVAFQLPWVLGGISTGFTGFIALRIFQVVLILGFIFEWQKGAQDWNSQDCCFLPFYNYRTDTHKIIKIFIF